MTIASCPKCSDEVALPPGASPKATVRCPLCQEEFHLSDILDGMPPLLVVVDDPEAAEPAVAAVPSFGTPAAGADVGELGIADADPVSVTPSFGIESSVAPATGAKPAARRRRAAPRPKKKRNPVVEVVKIVLGGIAGLTIAQLILWWNPWKPRDPFEIAPKVGATAPWIVPAELRGEKDQEAGSDETTSKKGPAKPAATPGKQDGLPTLTFDDPNKGGPDIKPAKAKKARRQTKPALSGGRGSGVDVAPADENSSLGSIPIPDEPMELTTDEPKTTPSGDDLAGGLSIDLDPTNMLEPLPTIDPKDSVPESASPADATKPAPSRFSNAPKLTAAEVSEALEDAQTIARAWNVAEDATSRELLRQTYRTLAGLGEAITFAGKGSQPDEAEVAGILNSLTADNEKLSLLGKAGEVWLRSQRDSSGVMLVGVVKSIEKRGDLYATKLALSADGNSVTLYSDADPADTCPVDSNVVVLGAIIDDPSSNLAGYEGDAKSVVWSRLAVAVPKP